MIALKDSSGNVVTYGEWKGDYLLEDVSLYEAAYFSNEEVWSVIDHFSTSGIQLTPVFVRQVF